MAVIALSGSSLNYSIGMGAFDTLNTALTGAMRSSTGLHAALGTLKLKISSASVFTSVGTSQELVQKAEARESEKQSALSVVYEKLDKLIIDTGVVDQRVSDVILSREDDFYKQYYYLKPDSKKDLVERVGDFCGDVWDGLCSIGNALLNLGRSLVEWCKENWIAIITAIGVLLVAILLVVFTPLSAVFIACIAGIIGLVLLATDIIVACCNDGKGIAELLIENGHPVLAQLFTGFQWGCDLVEILLPLGAAVKVMSKVGIKNFMKVSWVAMKKTCKETFEAVFKSGFKDGAKNALTIIAKSFLFDWDDLKYYKKDMINLATEPLENMIKHFKKEGDAYLPISDEAIEIFKEYGIDSLKVLPDGDIDWDAIAIKSVNMDMRKIDLPSDAISSYLDGDLIEGFKGSTPEKQLSDYLRGNTYSQANANLRDALGVSSKNQAKESLQQLAKQQFGLDKLPIITPHDHFSTKRIIYVPYEIHQLVRHSGAIAVYKDSIKTIARAVESSVKNIPWGRICVKIFN